MAVGSTYNDGLGEPTIVWGNAESNAYLDWNRPNAVSIKTRCYHPLTAVTPVCMKLRCPPIVAGIGRTITYSIENPYATEFVSDAGLKVYEEGARADFTCDM